MPHWVRLPKCGRQMQCAVVKRASLNRRCELIRDVLGMYHPLITDAVPKYKALLIEI